MKRFLQGMATMFFLGWLALALLQESGHYPSGEMVSGSLQLLLVALFAVELLVIACILAVYIIAMVITIKPTVGEWITCLTFVCLCIAAQQWGASMTTGVLAVAWAIGVMLWLSYEDKLPELNRQIVAA